MFTVTISDVIDSPHADVFGYVADFRNAPRWQEGLVAVHLADGAFPEGRRVVEVHRFLGLAIIAAGELVDWQPPDEFTVRGGPRVLRVESRYQFAPERAGTRIVIAVTMHPRGPVRLLEPVIRRRLQRRLGPALGELARVMARTGSRSARGDERDRPGPGRGGTADQHR